MRFWMSGKLFPQFIGPFEILERIGEVACHLALPSQLFGVHDVFHVSMLRKYEPDPSYVLDWTDLEVDEDASYEERPVRVMDRQEQVLRGKTIPLVKVLWKHHGVEEATWERELDVREKYPDLFVNVLPCIGNFVLLINSKNIVYVLVYGSMIIVEYISEMEV